ncbi:MAG: TonB-dependent receptor [Ignavibacteriaceae bacterium]
MVRSFLIVLIILSSFTKAQQNQLTGSIMGKVYDSENKLGLPAVNVFLKDKNIGASTDIDGNFKIEKLPVGNYVIVFSYIGYSSATLTDVIVRSNRITYQDAELIPTMLKMDSIVVSAGYFKEVESKSISSIEFSSEEIRRAPGSAGDVSRILFGLPSVAKINDGKSSFMVRGGSPVENAFYIDNIEISNINHFATQGSTDGFFGILNVDFIKNITFNAGGFSTQYGDKLSSVMDINLREGNRNEYDGQLNLNFAGIGAQMEGPFMSSNGSFMISLNKSYLDLVMKTFANDYPAPEYYDLQTKIVYDNSDKHKISFIDVFANDIYNIQYDKAIDTELNQFGNTKYITNTAGVNWQYIWGKAGYSNTSLSHTHNSRKVNLNETKSTNKFLSNNTLENKFSFRNLNFYKLNELNRFDFGIEAKYCLNDFDYTFFEHLDEYGNIQPAIETDKNLNTIELGGFINYQLSFLDDFNLSAGGRVDYFNYTDKVNVSPRIVLSYKLSPITSLSGSAGIYYQNLPGLILAQSDKFKSLNTPKAVHYILSFSHLLNEETRLTIELYQKNYSDLPVDPTQPKDFLFDQVVTNGIFTSHSDLINNGNAYSRGIEAIIQKKLAKDFYGMISASYSISKYKDVEGNWKDRIYDNRFNFNIEVGYKPNSDWEFSARFIYAGGAPYTPFDMQLSELNNKGILDLSKTNSVRLPDYHSLNIRVDRRFYFEKTNLVIFLSIWNVYNRENISAYTWNEVKNKLTKEVGWNTLPVFGIEYEF